MNESNPHSIPATPVVVKKHGIRYIEYFCAKSSHLDCVKELRDVLKSGGKLYERKKK